MQSDFDNALLQLDKYWQQRARIDWLQDGGKKTSLFHAKATARQARNFIKALKDQEGRCHTHDQELGNILNSYFKDLFTTGPFNTHLLVYLSFNTLSSTDCDLLTAPFSREEIYQTLHQLGKWKSPGSDDLPIGFYVDNWDLINNFVYDTILGILSGQVSIEKFNYTDLILFPKGKTQSIPVDYRPIGLCNVIYKIMSKTLSNRLPGVLPSLISLFRSAFIKGRTATDGPLVGMEILHHISKSSSNPITLKLDLSKAFDRIEWNVLLYVLRRMQFPESFINIIHQCISTSHIAIKFNGTKSTYFKPSRGLQQGDPISPLLFIVFMEVFSPLIQKVVHYHLWVLAFPRKHALNISHLMFADDVIIFTKSSPWGLEGLSSLFHTFCKATGLQINLTKSQIIFSRSASLDQKLGTCSSRNISEASNDLLCLGMSFPFGQNKSKLFKYLVAHFENKSSSWKGRMLSKAGN